jgi:predicted dehydrogenase
MAQDIRVAVIGTGYIAHTMVAAIGHVPGLTVVGICSASAERARSVADALGIATAFPGLDAVLADPGVDAVYIANNSADHAAAAIKAMEAGKAVLTEKPFAVDTAEAERVVAAARRTGVLFMEAVATPFLPAVHTALADVASGQLGPVRHLSASFGYPTTPASHPGCYAAVGGGVLLDRAVYLVTLARLALGPVVDVRAQITRGANGIDTEAALLLTHASGATAQLSASLTALLGNAMTIGCERGAVTVAAPLLSSEKIAVDTVAPPSRPTGESGLRDRIKARPAFRRLADLARMRKTRFAAFGASPYVPELLHFRDLYRSGAIESPVLPVELSLDVMRVLDAAREDRR